MRIGRCAGLAGALLLASCASSQRSPSGSTEPVARPDAGALRARAELLWQARVNEDWATQFLFQDPREQEQQVEADFIEWSQKNEPFKIHSFSLGQVQAEQDLGWVEVDHRAGMRRFPDLPPRDVKRWEKWRVVEGTWYPIPPRELDNYPDAPARRDALEESRLRARFAEAAAARQQRDWHRLYELTDPRDRSLVSEEQFAEREQTVEHLSCEVRWAEVIGERGRLGAVFRVKRSDPSMTKLPIETTAIVERWVKHENEWYLDLRAARP